MLERIARRECPSATRRVRYQDSTSHPRQARSRRRRTVIDGTGPNCHPNSYQLPTAPERRHPLPHRLRTPCSSPRLRQPAAPGHRRRPRGASTRPHVLSSVRHRLTRLHRPRRTVRRRLRCVSVRTGGARLQPRAGRPHSSCSGRVVVAQECGSSRLITPSSRAVAFSGSHPRRLWAPFFQRGGVRGCEG